MRQRTLAALAAGTVGFLALMPALALGKSGEPPDDPTTPTTSAASGSTTTTMMSTTTTAGKAGAAGPTTTTTMAADDTDADDTAADDTAADDTAGAPDDPSAGPDDPAADSEGTTDPGMSGGPVCSDSKEELPAPAVGESEVFEVGDAGTVEVQRSAAGELTIGEVVAEDGWAETVMTPSGPRVNVKFTSADSPDQIMKFAAALNSDGSVIKVKVSDCEKQ